MKTLIDKISNPSAFNSDCLRETAGKSFVISNGLSVIDLPVLKMQKYSALLKYWQVGWYQSIINVGKSTRKDTIDRYTPEKYWQLDWLNNMP